MEYRVTISDVKGMEDFNAYCLSKYPKMDPTNHGYESLLREIKLQVDRKESITVMWQDDHTGDDFTYDTVLHRAERLPEGYPGIPKVNPPNHRIIVERTQFLEFEASGDNTDEVIAKLELEEWGDLVRFYQPVRMWRGKHKATLKTPPPLKVFDVTVVQTSTLVVRVESENVEEAKGWGNNTPFDIILDEANIIKDQCLQEVKSCEEVKHSDLP